MTEATVAAVSTVSPSLSPPDDPLFTFTVKEWVAPSLYVPHKEENPSETNDRQNAEKTYKNKTTSTFWHRYLSLGRYAVSGSEFDATMEDLDSDPFKVHCIIWYNYMYHVDRLMECPPKLEAWAIQRSKPYLDENKVDALLVDTIPTTWKAFAKQQALTGNWSRVLSKHQRPKSGLKQQTLLTPFVSASKLGSRLQPMTITEEPSNESNSDGSSKRNERNEISADAASESSDGKRSALLPASNVPVCDGTYRVTVRWKIPISVNRISRQVAEMKGEIYKLLNDLFKDEDGYLYKWTDEGTDNFNHISKMSPEEVRRFICPTLTIIPSQSLAIIPIRYGFSTNTPSTWRNSERTKAILDKANATVSISNSTSLSGDLVISGYILLKAPTTTHRLRYLQSLRKQLPANTPPFDILLHKRSPTDESIPHLAVQCGEKHAHTLSEALMTILTGSNSPVFIPRLAFQQMSKEDAANLFMTHDAYIKAQQWLPLSPLLTNLDKLRLEHYPNGSTIERTTREWAREIKSLDGKEYACCDVVNGGEDQLSYLIFPPKFGAAAYEALEQYKTLINPFKRREERYRDKVGNATTLQFSTKVIANLEFMKKLSSEISLQSQESQEDISRQEGSRTSLSSGSTTSSVSEPTEVPRPPTPLESLRQLYRDRDQNSDSSTVNTDTTDSSRSTSPSKLSSDRLSTNSAKFREIDTILQRQKRVNEKKEQQSSDRISQIERQLHRLNDLETKIESVQHKVSSQLTDFEASVLTSLKEHLDSSGAAMQNMNDKFEKLMQVVEQQVMTTDSSRPPGSAFAFLHNKTQSDEEMSTAQSLQSSQDALSGQSQLSIRKMRNGVTTEINSPVKKRHRSAGKRRLKEILWQALEAQKTDKTNHSTIHAEYDSNEEMIEQDQTSTLYTTTELDDITTDLERQYTADDTDSHSHSSDQRSSS